MPPESMNKSLTGDNTCSWHLGFLWSSPPCHLCHLYPSQTFMTKQAHVSSLVLHHLAQMMADNSGPVGLLWTKACMYFKKGVVASQQV